MIIKPDFNDKIIIHAVGEFQIRLLILIYYSINRNYNLSYSTGVTILNSSSNYNCVLDLLMDNNKHMKKENIKNHLLYIPSVGLLNNTPGTIYCKNKLENYLIGLSIKENLDSWGVIVNNKIKDNLKTYKLITMKEFLNKNLKYIFSNEEDKNNFINKYPQLEISPIYQLIKNI